MEKLYLKELKNWMLSNVISKTIIVLAIILTAGLSNNTVIAQMECRSMIGAHLTPFAENFPVSWAIEGTIAPGFMTSPYDSLSNTILNGGMLLGALEFNFAKKSHIYIEGGYKNWSNSALVDDKNQKSRHLGIRQFFYSYSSENTKVKIGLHETRLGNYFLVDERILGGSIDQNIGAFTFNLRGGTVLKNFARMGQFCSNKHLYGVIHPDYTEKIGKKLGETNLAGLVINWNPHFNKTDYNDGDDFSDTVDEFSDSGDEFLSSNDENHENHDFNEFSEEDEFSSGSKSNGSFTLSNIGLILYDEFGVEEYIPDNKFYIGSLIDFELPLGIQLQTGAVYQNMNLNNAFVYIVKLGLNVTWNNSSNTKFGAAYIGKVEVDDNAIFQPLFSNLFLGEIMRLDAPDFPLWQGSVKHRFPSKMKFHVAVKAVGQIDDPKTNEQDLEFGMLAFKNHVKVTLIGSHVQTQNLPDDFFTARVEVRIAF